jgi:uncharacterized phage protein (TIGR02218 family)
VKNVSTALAAHLAAETTSLATCWKLTRRDATVMGFTDHDRDITLDGVTYKAATGFTPTATASDDSLAVDNLDVEGMLASGSLTESDILAGKYDFAEIEVFLVNWSDLTQGKLILRTGWLGEVTLQRNRFTAEMRGLTQPLAATLGEVYSPSCRAQFGDARCKIDLASRTVTGSVTSASSRQLFSDTARTESAALFTFGTLTFTSGANAGVSMEVKEYTQGTLLLALPVPYGIAAGDTYSLTQGCDKTFATCCNRFGNAVNFRGEPHVPGLDRMLQTAGTRSVW